MITFLGSETLLQISKYCISNAKINEFVMKKENEILSFIFYDIFTVKDGSRWQRFIFFCIRSWVILFFFSFSYFRTHNEIGLKIDTNKEREREIKWFPKELLLFEECDSITYLPLFSWWYAMKYALAMHLTKYLL